MIDAMGKFIFGLMLILAAFAKASAMDISDLQGRWLLEKVNEVAVSPDLERVYFEIKDQTIAGYDGCNRFGASLTEPSRVQRGQRGCPSEAGELQPFDYSNLLQQLTRAAVSGDRLSLPLPGGKGEASFRRAK